MKCPHCGNKGKKLYGGYCTKAHRAVKKESKYITLECASCEHYVRRLRSSYKGGQVFCPRCSKNSGSNHPNWKEGQYINPAGYRLILTNDGYKLEHRWVWEQANRACLLPEASTSIHHVDFDKQNNSPDNLLLLSSEEHGRIHRYIDNYSYVQAFELLINAGIIQLCFPKNIILIAKQWMSTMTLAKQQELRDIAKAADVLL